MNIFDRFFRSKNGIEKTPGIMFEEIDCKKEEQNKEFLRYSLQVAQEMIRLEDYVGLNKYLRMLAMRENLEFVNYKIKNPKEDVARATKFFSLFEKIEKSLSNEGEVVSCPKIVFEIPAEGKELYERYGHTVLDNSKPTFLVKSRPILLNCWNKESIPRTLSSIGKNNILEPISTMQNTYLYPLDLITCNAGNHRQLSAIIDNEDGHTTLIEQITDLRPLYATVHFDGNDFIFLNSGKSIYRIENSIELAMGTFYEIGRLLQNVPEYYPEYIYHHID
ncbi:TPA: DUF6710 family protein [Streptococcus suis]